MAYAALLSLSHVLDQIIIHDQYPVPLEKEKLVHLHGNVSTVLTFLEEYSRKFSKAISLLESRIIDAAYQAEDVIESQYSSLHHSESKIMMQSAVESANLHTALEEISLLLEEVMKIQNSNLDENSIPPEEYSDLASSSTVSLCDGNTVVGFEDDFAEIKRRVYQRSSYFEIIPIVGMGGIGKSTLARKLYDESTQSSYFDRFAWIVVSQEYSFREILIELLRTFNNKSSDLHAKNDGELLVILHKELYGRRYLIVIDDVWSTKACDEFNMALPKDTSGSRVLLTTRLLDVASYVGSSSNLPHEMHFLDEDQSWGLIVERVFSKQPCPPHLEQIGKKIAKSCRGLPLTIVVVSGILKSNVTQEYWENISHTISLTEPTIALRCSKVLSLSYEHLPLYLKPCFLYVTAFPEDYEIKVMRLINLWMAEGFVKPRGSRCLEDVAHGYLNDLVGRSLLLVPKKRYDGTIKCVGIHDALRDFGIQKAQEERFNYHNFLDSVDGKERRYSIYSQIIHSEIPFTEDEFFHEFYRDHATKTMFHLSEIPDPSIRSLLIFYESKGLCFDFLENIRLLRILDALTIPISFEVEKLVHLRYLATQYYPRVLPKSVAKIQNLQTLILHRFDRLRRGGQIDDLRIPLIVWTMPSLRHLIIFGKVCYLKHPTNSEIEETNLQTLSRVTNLRFTKQVIKMLVNLKKLGLNYIGLNRSRSYTFHIHNLIHLVKLEKLKIIFDPRYTSQGYYIMCDWSYVGPNVKLAFPSSIKKLTLDNIHCPWEELTVVGSLPNLEVLKLRRNAFTGDEWNPIEGQFLKLKYLEMADNPLSYWGAESVHFPSLEILFLQDHGRNLKEIPGDIGEISTLQEIRLRNCKQPIVESVMAILAEQRERGNEVLQIIFIN